jgi:hypothetical protein
MSSRALISELPSIFGRNIRELHLTPDQVPVFIPGVCSFLEYFADCVGIFRRCGMHDTVQELGRVFNLPECPVPPYASAHDVASFLKQFLRDLPSPLIPSDVLNATYQVASPDAVASVLSALPVVNRKTLAAIVSVLMRVCDNQECNQMTAANLTTCFATSLTQTDAGLSVYFGFFDFITWAAERLNDERDDFRLD